MYACPNKYFFSLFLNTAYKLAVRIMPKLHGHVIEIMNIKHFFLCFQVLE